MENLQQVLGEAPLLARKLALCAWPTTNDGDRFRKFGKQVKEARTVNVGERWAVSCHHLM